MNFLKPDLKEIFEKEIQTLQLSPHYKGVNDHLYRRTLLTTDKKT